ncbi:lamin tail domain-containing protein [Streptomyces sp. NPDC053086]|uniref:lamin tail domain-containing protein n=1 Tax=unclassified Streptomyces TaxID=2593676 RepID=UPI0037D2DE1E
MFVSASVTRRRVAAAVVAATAVVGAVALPASAADRGHGRSDHSDQSGRWDHSDHSGHSDRWGRSDRSDRSEVAISGAQYHASARYDRSNASLNKEWVEVTNYGGGTVNLDGWTLSDEDGHTYTFRHYRLGDHQSVRVHTGAGRDRKNDVYQDRHQSVWDSDHDTATLRNDHGRFIDATSWGYDHRGHRDGGWHGGRH